MQRLHGAAGSQLSTARLFRFSFPTRDGPTVCLANDTAYFDYDGAGNLRRADNGWAWVRRGYTPSGQVSHDTLVVRTYETSAPNPCGPGDRHTGGIASGYPDFTSHVYALRYSYDLEGRRTDLYHPDGVDFCPSGQCRTQYGYETATGALSQVTDPLGYVTSFAYDAAGRDTSTTYPGNVRMRRGYNADGNVTTRGGPFTTGDALTRDATGRLVSGAIGDIAGNGPANIRLFYGALGAAVYTENLTKGATFEEDSVDAVGNRLWQRAYGMNDYYVDRHRRLFLDSYTGRLDSIRLVPPLPAGLPENHTFTRYHVALYDAGGNSHQSYGWPNLHYGNGWEASLDEAVSYFDAEDRLRIFNRHVDYGPVSGPGGVYEEYRYDALGRRVLVRSRCTATTSGDPYCGGYVERTVWDGDQVLYEIRSPGQDSASSYAMENDSYAGTYPYTSYDALLGRVGYVHAGGIDAPLAVYRMNMAGQPSVIGVAPHANFQGDFEIGSMIGGSYGGWSSRSCMGYYGCPVINWPGGNTTMDGETPNPNPVQTWFGNLLSQKSDGSGLQYMRNRYYDPRTGRFTQSDPIGLAGGLNLHGFASGDPVNFSDPFGLTVTCTYVQRTGRMVCVDDTTGRAVVDRTGYAGRGAGRNNPELDWRRGVGPLPTGDYAIGTGFTHEDAGRMTLRLSASEDNEMYGRAGFLIHGDNATHNASRGCIVLDPRDRKVISDSGGGTLKVIPGAPAEGPRQGAFVRDSWDRAKM